MGKDNYRIVIPFTQTEDLELTTRLLDKQTESNLSAVHIELQKENVASDAIDIPTLDYLLQQKLPANLLRVISSTQHAFSHVLSVQNKFLIATATGLQVVKTGQILYFEYSKFKKQWIVVLVDYTCLLLKRNTVGTQIMEYSPSFFRINQHQIINLDYLKAIEGRTCKFVFPPADGQELIISRVYFKSLLENIKMI